MDKIKIRLDICTICNLNCVACNMRKLDNPPNGIGYLTFHNFKKFIDRDGQYIDYIEISNFGEPLLNPDFLKIANYAHSKGIRLDLSNGTNFNIKNDDYIKALVDYGFESITISCDGVTQECYEKYRRNGNVELVFDNIKKLVEYKKEKNSETPIINWQYILRESSENEVQLAIDKAKELGVDRLFFKLTWEKDYKPKDENKLKELTGLKFVTRKEFNEKKNSNFGQKCFQLWEWPTINWNGELLGCCRNKNSFKVNVFEVGLINALNSKLYLESKKWTKNEISELSDDNPCSKCSVYKTSKLYNSSPLQNNAQEIWDQAINLRKEE